MHSESSWLTDALREGRSADQLKSTERWQSEMWVKWKTPDEWPYWLDVYEAAAFLRVHPATIRRSIMTGRDGKAKLAHKRIRVTIRIAKPHLESLGEIAAR